MTASLYVHALRTATPRQLERRLTRPIRRRLFPRPKDRSPVGPLADNEELWRSSAFLRDSGEPTGLLAEFTGSYGEDVLEAAREGRASEALRLVDAWLDSSPPRVDARWHPYVVSTRIVSWLAASTLEPGLRTPRAGESIRRQLAYLARNVEDDILGNHVLRNATALVLGGIATGDDATRARGLQILARELPVQVLADGGHYERSPAYHLLVMRDLLQLEAYVDVRSELDRMRSFAAASARPDGRPALFNDGGIDIAARLELPIAADGLDVRRETGYAFIRQPGVWLAFDCGPPGPPYLPAHAHADGLSFQLWVGGRPLVVDPGTSTYEPGAVRRFERGSEAHSTVAVNGDQFVVWGSHRSGPLPQVDLLEAGEEELVGEVRRANGIRHRRTLRLSGSTLEVVDLVEGPGRLAIVSSLPFEEAAFEAVPASGEAVAEPRTVAERFGQPRAASALVVRDRADRRWEGGWRLDWSAAGRR